MQTKFFSTPLDMLYCKVQTHFHVCIYSFLEIHQKFLEPLKILKLCMHVTLLYLHGQNDC